jgi:L-alanine-DL-glutamate epimerase-like enolase superfamily enzyme
MQRRNFLKTLAVSVPSITVTCPDTFKALAATEYKKVKITNVKCMRMFPGARVKPWVKIETNAGLTGYGECHHERGGEGAKDVILNHLRQILVGQDPLDIERLTFQMMRGVSYYGAHGGITVHAVTGTESALWDLAGKILGVPTRKIICGGSYVDRVPAMRTASPRNRTDKAALKEWAAQVKADPSGIKIYKMDIERSQRWESPNNFQLSKEDLKRNIQGFENIREAVGDDIEIGVHCHWEFNFIDALNLARGLAPMRPKWLEDPLPIEFNEQWVKLTEQSPVPILCGENLYTRADFMPFIMKQGVHMISIDITMAGGLLEAKKISDLAELYYMPITAHNVASNLGTVQTAQCAATMREFYAHETFGTAGWGGSPDIIIYDRELLKNGCIQLNDKPGAGFEINPDVAKKYLCEGEKWWD